MPFLIRPHLLQILTLSALRRYFPAVLVAILVAVAAAPVASQQIVTAAEFFDQVSRTYQQIRDYSAEVTMRQDGVVMRGALSYRAPGMLRIDFTQPSGQVLVTDGEMLQIYYPQLDVIFEQQLGNRQPETANLASQEGLFYLKNSYAVSYAIGPTPVPLTPEDTERVVKLRLETRDAGENFRSLELAIDADNFIRRISGLTTSLRTHVIEFQNVVVNGNIPEARFTYKSAPDANVLRNFLFGTGEE